MKSSLKAQPYPVLGRGDDYVETDFQTTVNFELEELEGNEVVRISYVFLNSNPEILGLIKQGLASYALEIQCTDTLYREVIFCKNQSGDHLFKHGLLYGRVTIDPFIVSTKSIPNFFASDLNSEFNGEKYNIEIGDMIAVDDTIVRYVEYNKLKFESLVHVETSLEIPADTYRFDMSSDVITITMGKDIRRLWEAFREDREVGAPFLAMSIYKDVVLIALDLLVKDEDNIDQFKWGRAFKNKLSTFGISVQEGADLTELNSIAQKLISKLSVQRLLRNV